MGKVGKKLTTAMETSRRLGSLLRSRADPPQCPAPLSQCGFPQLAQRDHHQHRGEPHTPAMLTGTRATPEESPLQPCPSVQPHRREPTSDQRWAAQHPCPRTRLAERCGLSLEDQQTTCELEAVSGPAILAGDCGTDSLSAVTGWNKAGASIRAEGWNTAQP